MGLREWIIPQDRVFFGLLADVAANTVACADALADLLDRYDNLGARRESVKELEHRGDALTHEIFNALNRSFITPYDREDIANLAHSFDDVADYIYAAVNRLHLYEVERPTEPMKKFAQILRAQTRALEEALKELHSPRTRQAAMNRCIEVNRLENEADRLLNQGVATLFKGTDAIRILKEKEVLEMLETATDKCEDVADVIQDIVRKHA